MPSSHHPGATRPPAAPWRIALPAALSVLLGAWVAVSAFRPFTPALPQLGLDASWVAAMGQAADRGLRWGPDVAFTYGPASSLVTGYLDAAYLPLTLPLLLATCLLFGAATSSLARAESPAALVVTAAAAGLAAAFSAGFPDSFFLVLPLPPVLVLLARDRPGAGRLAVAAAAAVAVGAVGMAKMSFPLSALPLFVLGDAAAALRRRPPVLTVPCCIGFVASDLLYGQSLADLPSFVRQQGEVVAGYSEAMALDGSRVELLLYAFAAAALLGAALAGEWAGRRRSGPPRREGSRFALPLGLAWTLLLLFKAGFVRQDAHTLIAWHGLALAAVLWAAARLRPAPACAVGLAALVGTGLLGLSLAGPTAGEVGPGAAAWRILVAGPSAQLAAASELVRDPAEFAAARRAEQAAAWRGIAAEAPLPRLAGGVDVVPSEQSRVIASGLDYRPRPSFQEYSSYTPALLAANRAFLEGPAAPAWVLFGPEPGLGTLALDRRYPNLAEGALWPDLLRLYRPERRIGALAALHRRDVPLALALGAPRRTRVGFDEPVPVEAVAGDTRAVLATVEVRPTLLGRILASLYRPPPLTLNLRFADGHDGTYQFISGVGAAGFVLSPRVDNASDFEELARGVPPPPGRVVASFSIHAPPRMRAFLMPTVSVALQEVSGPPADRGAAAPASAWASLAAAQDLGRDASDIAVPPPSTFSVPATGLARLDLGFGLALPADAPPGAESICFAVLPADGSGHPLWTRCLDRAVPADRAAQSLSLPLPPGTGEVRLRATCRSGCGEGVEAYWSPPA